ncbi:hypothetical protein [Kitasatospora sp. NPDC090091]|uniref:hypothetical protein n=1 Tax=Kitasatospora sp. NPDC090091 TaxID=3364081 RepID=UPI003806EDE7
MTFRSTTVALAAAGLLSLLGTTTAVAAPAEAPAGQGRECGAVRLTGSLPAPAPGQAVQQQVTIGADCTPQFGPVTYKPASAAASKTAAASQAAAAAAAGTTRQLRSWNEMFDCCNIRMTGLYTTSTWTTDGGRITTAATESTQGNNREPWNAGWSVKSTAKTDDCTTDCAVVHTKADAEFSYQGIFDVTGNWYFNTHHSSVQLNGDSTASCTFDVELRHTFIGWNWQRGCE